MFAFDCTVMASFPAAFPGMDAVSIRPIITDRVMAKEEASDIVCHSSQHILTVSILLDIIPAFFIASSFDGYGCLENVIPSIPLYTFTHPSFFSGGIMRSNSLTSPIERPASSYSISVSLSPSSTNPTIARKPFLSKAIILALRPSLVQTGLPPFAF